MTPHTAPTDIVPSLSLSRRPPKKQQTSARATTTTKEKKISLKRPSIPIPSFQVERENLERIFDSDSSSSGSPPPVKRKKTSKRTRSCVPIPSFGSSDDDVLDDDEDEDILNTKPIFASEARKPECKKEDEPPATFFSNSVPISVKVTKTNESESFPTSKETDFTKPSSLPVASIANSATSTKCSQTAETNLLLHKDEQQDLSENEILQLAVGIARSLDPSIFSFPLVQSELEAQTRGAWKRVKLAKLRQFVLQQLEPTEEALHAAIDSVFLSIDIQSSTKKQFIAQVQDQFRIPFSQLCRTKITRRLTSLLNKETSPSVVAMVNRDAMEHKKTTSKDECVKANTVEEQCVTLTDSVPPSDGTIGASVEMPIDNSLPLPSSESNLDESDRKKPSSDKSESTRNPLRKPASSVARDVRQANPTTAKEKKPTTRVRKPSQIANEVVGVSEDILPKAADYSPIEKISRKRKAACQLCVNCPCLLSIDQPTISISDKHSNAAVEKNLIKRLQKLEKIADYYEEQTDSVRRILKKHRRDIWKKREASNLEKEVPSRPRFLPDAGELGEVMDSIKPRDKLGAEKSRKAQLTVFARAPVIAQSTLTQLLGVARTAPNPVLESGLEDIVEETEVDLENEALPASDDDDDDDKNDASVASVALGEEGYFQSEPVPFSRVECSNGRECLRSPAKVGGSEKSMWISMLTGRFNQCLSNIMENSDDTDDCSKMDNLVEMIDGASVPEKVRSSEDPGDVIEFSMLSQRAQTIAQLLIQETESGLTRPTRIERQCPQWKENVLFALHQRDSDDIAAALKQLESEKSKLAQKKALIVQAIEERAELLDVYENALKVSLSRFSTGSTGTSDHHTLLTPGKVKESSRFSLASEIPTVRFTASQCGFSSPLSVSSRLG